MSLVLALDLGTSSLKAGLVNQHGELPWQFSQRIGFVADRLGRGDAQQWRKALLTLLHAIPENFRASIRGVSVSGQGPSLVPLSADLEPCGPSLLWYGRGAGNYVSFFLPKIHAYLEDDNEARDRVAHWVSCPEYISFLLTGELVSVSPGAAFDKYLWSPEEIEQAGLRPESFPPIVRTSHRIGLLNPALANKFELGLDCAVFAGGSDFLMSQLGSGAIEAGIACDRAGSSEGINLCSDEPVDARGLRRLPHQIEGKWNIAGILPESGTLFEWFRRISGLDSHSYQETLARVEAIPIDANLPFFFASAAPLDARLERGEFRGLELGHGREHMGRAVVESIGFAVKEVLDRLEHAAGTLTSIRLSGGQAKNPAWTRMKADITGRKLEVPEVCDTELVGNACAAWCGLGRFASLADASRALVRTGSVLEPNEESHFAWMNRMKLWNEARGTEPRA